jgi:hypothetical protein
MIFSENRFSRSCAKGETFKSGQIANAGYIATAGRRDKQSNLLPHVPAKPGTERAVGKITGFPLPQEWAV